MSVRYVDGDLFADPMPMALAHGCNCAGAMGAGIAVQFRRRWPAMYERYRADCRSGVFSLGSLFSWSDGRRWIFNLATQARPGSRAEPFAMRQSLGRMASVAEALELGQVFLPAIGSGLGGLPWPVVRDVFDHVGARTSLELVVVSRFVAGVSPLSPTSTKNERSPR